ncbi:VOC family protein [Paenibacillus athensensis]|uniref:Glyoxalase n=1 Tax=Paenibacillus athensensis TaxID=1967502 RepID=A0A4Y8Q9B9_9BACL|nr:VOC family protein [Paenibacillus athensensis]MCD1260025.1 VOC family protein [Paenibacillus athensensis]
MNMKLEGITVLANDVARLAAFYRDVLGFRTVVEEGHYVEFDNKGVRLAICSKPLMADNTSQHPSFMEERAGQAFELNFECETPEEVHRVYHDLVAQGAVGITAPQSKSWGHTTGFFADPEGNIHSIFAVNPVAANEANDQ